MTAARASSLRRRLLVALLLCVAAGVALAGVAVYRTTRDEVDRLSDYQLRQIALSMRDRAFGSAPREPLPFPQVESSDVVIQVWSAQGVQLYLSQPHRVLPAQVRIGFADVYTSEGEWRVFGLPMDGQIVQVAQPMSTRRELALAAAVRTTLPFVLLLPALGLMIWIIVGRSLRPLDALARAVSGRRPDALQPVPATDAPREVQPLVTALNDLLARLSHALESQRAFLSDAAHELRTPLTALQLQAQLLSRARDEPARQAALAELRHGLARASHLVAQLLTLARLEPGVVERPAAAVGLADLAREVVTLHSGIAVDKAIDLGIEHADDAVAVIGDREALATMLSNLVENAVRYTPRGGRVDVSVGATGGRAWLKVSDTGPGISAEERSRVFDRFYRGAGQDQPGTGLGLAIAKAVADRHGAEIRLDEPAGGGLLAEVAFAASTFRQPVPEAPASFSADTRAGASADSRAGASADARASAPASAESSDSRR